MYNTGAVVEQFKVGIVVVNEQSAFAHRNMIACVESLKALGCNDQNILVKHAPRIQNVTLVVQFFAEYTDVDAVIILMEQSATPEYNAMLYAINKLQIAWNMPVVIGDCTVAEDAYNMVAMQNEMEAAAPEHISPDRKSIN